MSAVREISPALRGIACVAGACLLLTMADAFAKLLTETLPVMEIALLRSTVALVPILVIARFYGPFSRLRTRHPGKQMLRGFLIIGSYTCFLLAIQALPLAETASVFFSAPLLIAGLSPLVLKEKVPLHRWIAICIGFAGVLVIMRPGTESFRPEALFAFASAVLYALGALMARRLGAIDPPATTSFYTGLCFLLISGPFTLGMPGYWVTPDWTAVGYVTVCGLIAGTGHFLLIQGYRLGEASVVAPFEYSTLLWSVMLGFAIWGDLPTWWTLGGVLLVAASGLYVLRTERR
ncbi:MAG: DMT family transporter [Proteobacteria bacterium]|nr:DMT family transporter [Pseudomonadota bacterium]